MTTTITCDRCQSKIKPRPDGCEQTKILFMPAASDDLPEYDLCVPCTQEFRQWMKGSSAPTRARTGTRTREEITPDPKRRSP